MTCHAPHVIPSSYTSVSGEYLPQVLYLLPMLGAFLRSVQMEAVTYRVEFCHPEFEDCETDLLFSKEPTHGRLTVCIRNLGPASAGEAGTAETAKTGSVHEHATAESGDAQTVPNPSSRERK